MFLKITYQNNVKKVKLPKENQNIDKFLDYVGDVISQPKEDLKISFKDSEGDKIIIEDAHDLEYFIHHFKGENFALINIENIEEKEEEPLQENEIVKQKEEECLSLQETLQKSLETQDAQEKCQDDFIEVSNIVENNNDYEVNLQNSEVLEPEQNQNDETEQ